MQPATKPCKYCKLVKEGMESYKCDKCYSLSHLACMKCKKPSRLKGDFLFLYECKDCNFQKKDVLTRMKLSWVQVIHLALYNLTVNERGRQGFFKWKEEICVFIEKNWSILMPGKAKPSTWIGTIAGTLSVHSHKLFKSGQLFFNETGWWALQEVTIPKANAENYRIQRPIKESQNQLLKSNVDVLNNATEFGRGKRQRKPKNKPDESSNLKTPKLEPSTSNSVISPASCVKSAKPTKPNVERNQALQKQNKQNPIAKLNTLIPPSQIKKEIVSEKPLKETENVDTRPLNSSCEIMAELKDAAYTKAVLVDDPFASLFDDISVFDVRDELLHDDVPPRKSPLKQSPIKSHPKYKSSDFSFIPIDRIKPEPSDEEDSSKVVCKPMENLNAIKPIEKVSNLKPLTVVEESEFLAKLNDYPLTVNSDCSVRRLRRKLLTRKTKRELGVPLFGIKKEIKDNDLETQTQNASSPTEKECTISEKESTTKPSFNHPALVGVNVLDKFLNMNKANLRNVQQHSHQTLTSLLIGTSDQYGGYQNSIVSPYTSRILKPYIRRDFTNAPLKLKILRDIQTRGPERLSFKRWPIDYCYVQPMHIPGVNSLCNDFFWPGIDLTECLQYPEFSCVVMYRKLLVGFAFMVPDVKFNEAYISFVLVHPDWRRSGIATNMIYHLIQTCMGKDITLHVSPSNPSMLLYQKFGFKAEALILDFYKKYMPEEDQSSKHAFLMRLQR